ncbi:MAG: NitT/TauT family transport system ATP-binding protein [Colwellia sp.]|jgi:NitT/TauT family transport system ATP-binding protein|tara:strand:- start:39911 stop:40708 length:798 start_codon:yes stop_codon:yes gene_type:complete
MSFLEINNVWKSYGDAQILERLNLTVEQGEFVSMVGASGCGKSTFLNLLLGKEKQTKGAILLEGKPLIQEPDEERGIVFQRYSVFPHLTVLQNVMIADEFSQSKVIGWVFGKKKAAIKVKAEEFIDAVGLTPAVNKYPHELSGGMQQRLAIAQALMKAPKILLLDEPFGALDPGIRADMHVLIRDIWKKNKLTIFMVTHDIKEGFELGSRIWVFDKVRHDPQAPNAYGAQVTYDLDLSSGQHCFETKAKVEKMTTKAVAQEEITE